MKAYQLHTTLLCFLIFFTSIPTVKAQEGDQILDGIGETALVARYVLDGNTNDWSRNNLKAQIFGDHSHFITDDKFGEVLDLSGENSYLKIPGNAFTGLESISITGWIYLNERNRGTVFFDFGKKNHSNFYVLPSGTANKKQAILNVKLDRNNSILFPLIPISKWIHIAVVLDNPSKKILVYINGSLASESKTIYFQLSDLFDHQNGKNNFGFIGKSKLSTTNLNAKIHDFRIYRTSLNENQIKNIYSNAFKNVHAAKVNTKDVLPQFSPDTPQLYTRFLKSVSNVSVTTFLGDLPRLPRYVNAVYTKGIYGPKVRVLWPEPKDNHEVLHEGKYTIMGYIPGTKFKPKVVVTVKSGKRANTPQKRLEDFGLGEVLLNNNKDGSTTKFIENRDKFINTLAKTNPDAFLYMFRNAYGITQPKGAEPLEGWDSQETKLRGHATGHYLTAIAQAYASTVYDKNLQNVFAKKIEYMINTLYQLSQMSGNPKVIGKPFNSDPTMVPPGPGKLTYNSDLSKEEIRTDYWNWGEGYLSAYPPDQFIMLEHGATYGGQDTQIWAPYYTLHKILAGLLDVYEVSSNKKALTIATGMADWVYARLRKLPKETLITMWNTYIAGEYGGMNEVLARLYRITNHEKYLKEAQLFDNIEVFFGNATHDGLAKNVDTFRGLHANQHIPQIIGALETYRDSNNSEYYRIADNFWYRSVNDYTYSIGGVAGARNPTNAECYIAEPATLYKNGFSKDGQNETCGTYNMLKLTRGLFMYHQEGVYMDYYERALYNQILASVAENSPANTYHIPLNPGAIKQFSNPDMTGFTCCNGTALESSTKLQNTIYFKSKDNSQLYVNLYIPSTLKWKEKGISIEQITNFPNNDVTSLKIHGNGNFDIKLRVPSWATKGFYVKINNKNQKVNAIPGSYLTLKRVWKDADVITLQMPFSFHLESIMDQQNIASLFYGPVLLAAQEKESRTSWRKVTLNAKHIDESIKGNPKKLQFTIDGVLYKPFYNTYGHSSVYLDVTLK
ncbi:beta-L-arabinofuranosidase domain-containing protein [Zhouia sp. PK063]|uniref:beta-L-arabinofuranosidase domain-containing protein n=1 Tax=Zhouia sp. PK063 TaxID=3373602 RepID=UPI0037A07940